MTTQDTAGELRRLLAKGAVNWSFTDAMRWRDLCGSGVPLLLDERDRLRAALDGAVQVAFDGPRETVGTNCKEGYWDWRKRIERECREALGGGARKEESHGTP